MSELSDISVERIRIESSPTDFTMMKGAPDKQKTPPSFSEKGKEHNKQHLGQHLPIHDGNGNRWRG